MARERKKWSRKSSKLEIWGRTRSRKMFNLEFFLMTNCANLFRISHEIKWNRSNIRPKCWSASQELRSFTKFDQTPVSHIAKSLQNCTILVERAETFSCSVGIYCYVSQSSFEYVTNYHNANKSLSPCSWIISTCFNEISFHQYNQNKIELNQITTNAAEILENSKQVDEHQRSFDTR